MMQNMACSALEHDANPNQSKARLEVHPQLAGMAAAKEESKENVQLREKLSGVAVGRESLLFMVNKMKRSKGTSHPECDLCKSDEELSNVQVYRRPESACALLRAPREVAGGQ
jgi:hypothetical protein